MTPWRRAALVLSALLLAPPAAFAASCAAGVRLVGHPPVLRLAGPAAHGSDRGAERFLLAVMQGSGAFAANGDRAAAAAVIAELGAWAAADALTQLEDAGPARSNTNTLYSLRRALVGLLGAWAVLAPAAPAAERAAITAWLGRLVALQATPTGALAGRETARAVSNHNNHALLRASVEALWAAVRGDAGLAANAAAMIRTTRDTMRHDGSLPLETARGARALWYQRHAIASFVTAGEALARLNIDVWAPRPDGRSLHDAVGFLVAAVRDPALVAGYAAAERDARPGEDSARQELGFLAPRGHGRHYMAWVEPYRQRFPDHPLAAALAGLVQPSLGAARPLIDEISGGNTTCLLRGAG